MAPPSPAQSEVIACERTFRRYGLPLLIDNHSSRRDVFGRAAPLLVVLLLIGVVGSVDDDWAAWQNGLLIAGGAVLVGGAYAAFNVVRGRRWSALPQDVGLPELAFWVLVPAIPPLVAGWQWTVALGTVAVNLAMLAAIWLVVRYGIHSTLWWGLRGGVGELGSSLLRLIRFLPLLLIFSLALFYTTEVWQVFDHTAGVSDFILGGFFALLILAILRIRLGSETAKILEVAEQLDRDEDAGRAPLPPFTKPQRANVTVMIAMGQLLQVLVVSVAVGVFFVALGMLTITQGVMDSWDIDGGNRVWLLSIADATDLRISQTLLRVSVALATFTGLYYAISVLTDSLYRDDFINDMAGKMHDVHAHRRRYAEALEARRAEITKETP